MGVHGLWALLKPFSHITNPEEWRGKRVAVDASIWISQFSAMARPGEDTKEVVLQGFVHRLMKLIFYDIRPVIVFDGTAPDLKVDEQMRRRMQRKSNDQQRVEKQAKRIVRAHVASGLLDVQRLPLIPLPREERKLSPPPSDVPAPPQRPSPRHQLKSSKPYPCLTHRGISTIEQFAAKSTKRFIHESASVVKAIRKQQELTRGNRLAHRTYSTRLFLGTRAALTQAVNRETSTHFSSSDHSSASSSEVDTQDSTASVVLITEKQAEERACADVVVCVSDADSDGQVIDVDEEISVPEEQCRDQQRPVVATSETRVDTYPLFTRVASTSGSKRAGGELGRLRYEQLEIISLLDTCGIPYIFSPSEADSQCAFLSRMGLVDAVFTEDSDAFAFGARVVLRGFFGNGHVLAYEAEELERAGLTSAVICGLAMLTGCDYSLGIQNVGCSAAVDVLTAFMPEAPRGDHDQYARVFGSLVAFRRFAENGFDFASEVERESLSVLQLVVARALARRLREVVRVPQRFPEERVMRAFADPLVDESISPFRWGSPDFVHLRRFIGIRGLQTPLARIVLAEKAFNERANAAQQRDHSQQSLHRFGFLPAKQHPPHRVTARVPPSLGCLHLVL